MYKINVTCILLINNVKIVVTLFNGFVPFCIRVQHKVYVDINHVAFIYQHIAFNSYAAELFQIIFHSFEAGIANALSSSN